MEAANEFQHRLSFWLVKNFGTVVVEDLNVKGLAGGMLAKSVHDAGWATLVSMIAYKAENADAHSDKGESRWHESELYSAAQRCGKFSRIENTSALRVA